MKKTLFVFLLPLMVLGQPVNQSQNEFVEIEISMEINFQSEIEAQLLSHEFEDNTIAFKLTMQIPLYTLTGHETPVPSNLIVNKNRLPKSLNTFSLAGLYGYESTLSNPQKRLNSLIAMNDPEYPKANTLLKGLNSVPVQKYQFSSAKSIVEGFGPRISL